MPDMQHVAPLPPDDDSDVRLTPTMRAYLSAFDEFLFAETPAERQFARSAMGGICNRLLDEAGLPSRARHERLSAEDLRDAA